ncbi:hypothetical protein [Chryseobacterium sp.]|uniref:hypothetical protein n=1 Tax=Chryseobacterium sp. TaxID=1871047 RepID=UPI0035ADB0B2
METKKKLQGIYFRIGEFITFFPALLINILILGLFQTVLIASGENDRIQITGT